MNCPTDNALRSDHDHELEPVEGAELVHGLDHRGFAVFRGGKVNDNELGARKL